MAKKKNYPLNYVKRFSSLREMIDMAAKEAGDKPAFRYRVGDKDVSVSYSEFRLDVLALGTGLSELGVDTEHIAIISENRYDWINVYLAVLCSAGVFVPVDKDLPDGDKVHVLLHSDSHVLFFSGAQEKFVRENIERLPDIKYFIGLEPAEPGYKSFRLAPRLTQTEKYSVCYPLPAGEVSLSYDGSQMRVSSSGAGGLLYLDKNLYKRCRFF